MNDVILMKAVKEARENGCQTDQEIVDVVFMMGWSKREIRSMIARMKRSPWWNINTDIFAKQQPEEPIIKKFEVGETYSCNSVCDSDCWWHFKIVKRSAKSIWTEIDGEVKCRRISIYRESETFMPFGSYSMAPIVRAER
jgi:hypothetical protein